MVKTKIVGISEDNTGPAAVLGQFLELATAGKISHVVIAAVTADGSIDSGTSSMTQIEYLGIVSALQARAQFESVIEDLADVDDDGAPAA
jgi:hypothetical protein